MAPVALALPAIFGSGLLATGASAGTALAAAAGTAAIAGTASYLQNQQAKLKEATNALSAPIKPLPAATPATLAQAAASQSTRANGQLATPTKAKASGTIGAEGPQGLTAPPQTANVTLLGGTR